MGIAAGRNAYSSIGAALSAAFEGLEQCKNGGDRAQLGTWLVLALLVTITPVCAWEIKRKCRGSIFFVVSPMQQSADI